MSARHCRRTLGFLVGLALGSSSPSSDGGKGIAYYRTTASEDCELVEELEAEDGTLRAVVPEGSILTLTTPR